MKSHYLLDVQLTLLGPILSKGGHAEKPGIDAPVARDSQHRVMLPYSLVKGKVLDAFHDLGRGHEKAVQSWLGTPSKDGSTDPDRGRLRFGDFVTEQTGTNTDPIIERIRIDSQTGSVVAGALQMIEAPFGYGKEVMFAGTIEFIADATEAKTIHAELQKAFDEVPAFGALRTVGFGRTKDVSITLKEAPTSAAGTPATGATLPVRLCLDRPFCVVGPKHSGNHFDSLTHIPGAVLKGAVARLVLEVTGTDRPIIDQPIAPFPKLTEYFARIRFAEARPMRVGSSHRLVVPPLSLVSIPKCPDYWDVALWEKPELIRGAAPLFAIDWKDETRNKVEEDFGQPPVPLERRTRTAINRDTGRADDAKLFSYGLVVPNGFVWETVIGLEHVPTADRAAIVAELQALLAYGLPNIGKTRATGHVEWLTNRTPPLVGTTAPDGFHVVTLQADCLMTDPGILTTKGLEAAYRAFWEDVSGGAFELVRYFAQQTLHGGYLAKRSRQPAYEPYLLTDRGSTFVLKPTGKENVTPRLETWRDTGLPTPKWVETRYGQSDKPLWQTCPFLPHVGYGEVAIDLSCHVEKRLAEQA